MKQYYQFSTLLSCSVHDLPSSTLDRFHHISAHSLNIGSLFKTVCHPEMLAFVKDCKAFNVKQVTPPLTTVFEEGKREWSGTGTYD